MSAVVKVKKNYAKTLNLSEQETMLQILEQDEQVRIQRNKRVVYRSDLVDKMFTLTLDTLP